MATVQATKSLGTSRSRSVRSVPSTSSTTPKNESQKRTTAARSSGVAASAGPVRPLNCTARKVRGSAAVTASRVGLAVGAELRSIVAAEYKAELGERTGQHRQTPPPSGVGVAVRSDESDDQRVPVLQICAAWALESGFPTEGYPAYGLS